jgi:uncharacterized protein (DUF433 family)
LAEKLLLRAQESLISPLPGHLASDMSIEEILDEYDLTVENIRTTFAYAAKRNEFDRQ